MIPLPDWAAKGKACPPGVESLRRTFLDTPKTFRVFPLLRRKA